MTKSWNSRNNSRQDSSPNRLVDKTVDFSAISDEDSKISYHNAELKIFGCKHYQRGAKLQGHCCGKWFPCRFCHDEVSDHNIER